MFSRSFPLAPDAPDLLLSSPILNLLPDLPEANLSLFRLQSLRIHAAKLSSSATSFLADFRGGMAPWGSGPRTYSRQRGETLANFSPPASPFFCWEWPSGGCKLLFTDGPVSSSSSPLLRFGCFIFLNDGSVAVDFFLHFSFFVYFSAEGVEFRLSSFHFEVGSSEVRAATGFFCVFMCHPGLADLGGGFARSEFGVRFRVWHH